MTPFLRKLVGDTPDRAVKKLQPLVAEINSLELEIQALSDEQLREKTKEFRDALADGEALDDLLPEAFATVREAAKRNLGQRHYDVQLMGGVVLHQGQIAEMKTGEGKTLVATLPVYLNALTGDGVHIVTVNDYLARRDAVWMGAIYHALGLTIGCLQHDSAYLYDPAGAEPSSSPIDKGRLQGGLRFLRPVQRTEAYRADITYGTNNEFGFDYLRDNMVLELSQRVQRELNYAIVDEVDNILVDEARTPLIISGPADEPEQLYYTFAKLVPRLQQEQDFAIDQRTQAISLTQEGISKMERWTRVQNLYDPENYHQVHYMENALTAHVMKKKDKDYVVREGEVVIVDEFTGRLQFGRRWSDGLHQAVEAKEGIKIQRESITYATITLQNYFRMYKKLAGMTGTAVTEADEFFKIYRLEVASIPTNLPMIRQIFPDLVYQDDEGKWRAVVKDIEEASRAQRPVLVGTTSVEASEQLSQRLKQRGIPHQVLNAKNHENEAGIVAQAGSLGAVTVSTNMAGRGTDIVLGGSDTAAPDWQEQHQKVVELGGLYVIGTEHHEARRIDNQLRGRSGRQGDPGSSRFYASLEDELMRRFGGERIKSIMNWAGMDKDTPIENRLVTKAIENAQVKVESYHFDIRKHLLEYDDVLNKHREMIYQDRHRILAGHNFKEKILDMSHREFDGLARKHLSGQPEEWNVDGFISELSTISAPPGELADEEQVLQLSQQEILEMLQNYADTIYAAKEADSGSDRMRLLERLLMLRTIDIHWVHHLTALENLRTGIGLHAYGQRDPLIMYRAEGHKMFQDLLNRMQHDVVHTLFHVTIAQQPDQPAAAGDGNGKDRVASASLVKGSPMKAVNDGRRLAVAAGSVKTGRNDPCPCGSGKKYKRCHG